MYQLILIIQGLSILGLFIECWIVLRHAKGTLHSYLFLSCIATLFNNLGYLLELMAHSEEAYFTALRMSYLGRVWIGFALLVFIVELTQRNFLRGLKYIFAAINVFVYIAMFTTRSTGLYYKNCSFIMNGDFPVFVHEDGIVHNFWSATLGVYIILGLGALFTEIAKEKDKTRRKQLLMVLSAVLAQSIAVIIQLLKLFPVTRFYDLTMIGYPIGTIFMLIAILRYDLLDTEAIARQYVIDQISEAIMAVDKHGIVRFVNEPVNMLVPLMGGSMESAIAMAHDAAVRGSTISAGGRIFTAKESSLELKGKRIGTLYMLVDSTSTYRYLEEIRLQKRIADRANKAKSAFLANMSHEIRTPINSILGMDEMIMRESKENNIIEYAENIESAGRHLLSIINDILDISKIEEGKVEIIPVDYDLSSVINDLTNMIQARAESKGLSLKLEVDDETPKMLTGDEIRIKQVASNILTNAVKYTKEGSVTMKVGYEKIEGEPDSINLKFSITDTGIGIKQEDIPKMFKAFERIETSRNRNIEGTGLGMSISKRLLDMMGSKMEVESEYGKGSTFSFAVKQKVIAWEPIGQYEDSYKRAVEGRKEYKRSFTAPDARILIIDDTPMNLAVFKGLLKQTLMHIDTAISGDEGIALAKENKYDILFIDHMMPHKDGIETLVEIRKLGVPSSGAVTVCLTANAISGAREGYLKAGFDDYIPKPIEAKRLEHMIMDYLPKEKVLKEETPEADEERTDLPEWLFKVNELDITSGLQHCGTNDIYLDTLSIYASSVKGNADGIEAFLEADDVKNATIKIHALKSTSRMIGAVSLGDLAEKLEAAGNANDVETLKKDVPDMLKIYRTLGEELSKVDEGKKSQEGELDDRDSISLDELKEAYTAIREFMSVADYDSALQLIEEISMCRVPEEEQERCDALIKAADEFEYEVIVGLLKEGK